ncbi:hypothetical protein CL656_07055 [bacterium]|nr:hypothetical protein [bacterium]
MSLNRQPNIYGSMGLAGTTAITAVNFTHPLDLYKTRLQADNFNFYNLMKNEGVFSFWKGIKAAYLREATYTSIKLGCYSPIKKTLNADNSFIMKFVSGSISGTFGVLVGNPFDVMKTISITNTKNNLSLSKSMYNMYEQQGIGGFYRGVSANIGRACVLNGTKMSCYDQIKGYTVIKTNWDRKDIRCQAVSAFLSGFFMAITSAPFDMIRTTLMNQPTDKKIYNGFMDAGIKIVSKNGPLALYKGFFPIWARFAPTTILQLIIFDNLLNFCGFETI